MGKYCDFCKKLDTLNMVRNIEIKINHKALATDPVIFKGDLCVACEVELFKLTGELRNKISVLMDKEFENEKE